MSRAIPVSIDIEHAKRQEDELTFDLHLKVLGAINSDFACTITTDFYENPRVIQAGRDAFGLPPDLRDRFAVALYEMLVPHLVNDEPTYPAAVQIDDPDLRPWIEATFYRSDAMRLIRLLSANVDPAINIRLTRRTVTARID